MRIKRFIILIISYMLIHGCTNPTKKENKTKIDSDIIDSTQTEIEFSKDSINDDEIELEIDSEISELIKKADSSIHDFSFELLESETEKFYLFTGYIDYSDDEFEFKNPAYLKIYKNNDLIFQDTFEGYEEIRFQDFDGYLFNNSIHLFTLEFGLQACDYINPSRLYYINNEEIGFIDEYYSQSNINASKYIEFKFPTDSGGIKNHLLVLDNIYNKTGEEPNISDTIYYKFELGKFIKTKAANTH